mmetsp:Transcript_3417/g.6528  ORF Transcript_3417/g.6528 Transcript_3417/m.6528 type:complete len:94 (-) Transcript_3417:398-679(-)
MFILIVMQGNESGTCTAHRTAHRTAWCMACVMKSATHQRNQHMTHNHKEISAWCRPKDKEKNGNCTQRDKASDVWRDLNPGNPRNYERGGPEP